jgi:hypothetical protein
VALEQARVFSLVPKFLDSWCNSKDIVGAKQMDGLATKSNNADWSARSKSNSYHCDKAQSRHDLGGEGAAKDLKATETYPSQVRKSEGRGWAPMDKVTQANTFTGTTSKK